MTTINKQVSASSDDAVLVNDAWFSDTDTALSIGHGTYVNDGMARWQSLNIPNAATITSATLSIYVATVVGSLESLITGVDENSTLTWADGNTPADRPRTTATVNGNAANWGNYGAGKWATIDIKTIIQEIVNRVGWAANNDLGIAIDDAAGAGSNYITVRTYDYAGNAHGAKLEHTAHRRTQAHRSHSHRSQP